MREWSYRDRFVCYCFGGGGSQPAYTPTPPPPPTNIPATPGSDQFQRFQDIRSGLLTGQTTLIQPTSDDKLGTTKGSNVAAATQ
jgi:hypothetical protein